MKIKANAVKNIPDPKYLIYQFYCFSILEPDDQNTLAQERIKRLSSVFASVQENHLDQIDTDALLQSIAFFCSFCERDRVPFFPNIYPYMGMEVSEPKLPITQALLEEGYLTPEAAELFDNKFRLGFESRIYDGMPINWNGDANSIVTLFIVLSVLKIIENDGKFDTMIHRERPRKSLKNDVLKDDDPFSNLATLIYGDFYKKDNRNFIIKGNNSFDTINRRCNGIKRKITDLLDDFQSFSQEKLIERLMNRTDCLNIKNEKKHGSIDERIDLKAVKLIYSTYRDSSIKSETSVIKNDKKKNSRRPPLCPHVVTNRQE